jgi:membrane protease YdiL (CAAX protease family)
MRARLAESRRLILFELALVAFAFWADAAGHVILSKTLYLLPVFALSVWIRGAGWKAFGLTPGSRFGWIILLGLVGGAVLEAQELFITQPILTDLAGHGPDLSDFKVLEGNPTLLAIGLVAAWTLAAFGEELVYRAWLMPRVAQLFGGKPGAWVVSLFLVSVLFGFAHGYQGWVGMTENVIDGLILGVLYLLAGRNLWAPVIAHGMQDTIDLLLIYSGAYPGL